MPPRRVSNARQLAGLGWELGGAILGGGLAGYFIDYKFQTGHKGLVIGLLLGIVGGLYNLIRKSLMIIREQDRARGGEKDDLDSSDETA